MTRKDKNHIDSIKPAPFNAAMAHLETKAGWLITMAAQNKLSKNQMEKCRQKIEDFDENIADLKDEMENLPNGRYI